LGTTSNKFACARELNVFYSNEGLKVDGLIADIKDVSIDGWVWSVLKA
jgi:hypothetical protein